MVTKASFAYPAVRLSDAEARVRLEVYTKALEDLPTDVLGEAFLEAVRTIKFFPSVAELRTIAGRIIERRRIAALPPPRPPEPAPPEISAEERAEVAQMMSELVRGFPSHREVGRA